jgi:hypothetical protein
MHELFIDPFASHVYQAILHTVTGHPQKNLTEERTAKRRRAENTDTVYSTPQSFIDLRNKFFTLVKKWDQSLLQSLVLDKYAVPLLQVIIECDVPKRPKKKSKSGRTAEQTLADLILFGKDPDSKGINLDFLANE